MSWSPDGDNCRSSYEGQFDVRTVPSLKKSDFDIQGCQWSVSPLSFDCELPKFKSTVVKKLDIPAQTKCISIHKHPVLRGIVLDNAQLLENSPIYHWNYVEGNFSAGIYIHFSGEDFVIYSKYLNGNSNGTCSWFTNLEIAYLEKESSIVIGRSCCPEKYDPCVYYCEYGDKIVRHILELLLDKKDDSWKVEYLKEERSPLEEECPVTNRWGNAILETARLVKYNNCPQKSESIHKQNFFFKEESKKRCASEELHVDHVEKKSKMDS